MREDKSSKDGSKGSLSPPELAEETRRANLSAAARLAVDLTLSARRKLDALREVNDRIYALKGRLADATRAAEQLGGDVKELIGLIRILDPDGNVIIIPAQTYVDIPKNWQAVLGITK